MKLSKTSRMTSLALCTAVLSSLAMQGHADENSTTLSTVLDRGYLICGVGVADIGFAAQQVNGNWAGFDVDFCRAVAAATLGDAQAVEFVPLDSLNRLRALKDGDVDVLFRTTTYTMDRDVALGFEFPAITYYDSQRVLAHASTNAKRLADLDGFTICANAGTTSIANIRKAIEANDVDIDILEISSQAGRWRAFFGQECDAVTSDYSDLSAMVAAQGLDDRTFVILDDEIANEPLSAVVLEGDQQWEQIIRWVVNLLVLSEAEGVGKDSGATVISQLSIPAPTALGLSDDWASQIISQVGNYGDIFARNLGDDSALGIKRGLNNLWRDGGLMYALPMSTD